MQLDAAMCDTLVAIVKEKTGAKDSRALPLNQATTNIVGQLRADSFRPNPKTASREPRHFKCNIRNLHRISRGSLRALH